MHCMNISIIFFTIFYIFIIFLCGPACHISVTTSITPSLIIQTNSLKLLLMLKLAYIGITKAKQVWNQKDESIETK